MKQSDCTSMIHQTAPPTTQPPSPLRESYGADRDSTGMQLPIIGIKKKEASEGNAASGICESGIGVQTAIQQCQPADGRLAACAGPLVSHQQRNQERRRGDEGFKEGEWLQSLDSSLWRQQILTLRNAAAAGLETPASQLPAASIAVSPSYPRLFILRLLSLTTLTFSLS